jgi:hypothetical protein
VGLKDWLFSQRYSEHLERHTNIMTFDMPQLSDAMWLVRYNNWFGTNLKGMARKCAKPYLSDH